ncbi:peptidase E [Winogradskyella sp. PC-19]|uniref:DUF6702 family protein n=1 Tax=unclassified Winogradskyella TaxID=2615021 RepID=UPI000B3D4257|nr:MULTISPECIES: DUF6702 family protein [unclassified Winogradskyella]ARV10263.1 peptidase E [Winogradskyella sp. PC-19]RZN78561.1 MAG: peptidase E [Winogradskyella sp.]
MKKLKYSVVIIIAFLLFTSGLVNHEYYVSVTKIEYVKKEKSLQIISQIFIDDFEKLIHERYDESVTLAVKNESKKIDGYMEKYLKYKLDFKVNTQDLDFNFLGKEYKEDIVYCYLEIENIEAIKTLEIKNEVLFDIYPKQQNILRTKINGKDKSFILIPQNNKAVLNFD